MLKRAKCGKTLPLLAAVESKESWQDVLSIYFKTCSHLKNVYTPTNKELLHGLSKMPSSWSTSLFYYEIIKKGCGIERPDRKIVLEVLHRYKVLHNFNGIQRILNEDVSSEGLEGAQSALLLASYTNMWEKSLEIVARHPSILASSTNRRSVINTLCNAGHWEKALRVLRANGRDLPPGMIRPIVKRLSLEQNHQRALELVALSFAQGYTLSPNLLSGLLFTLRETNHWETALELAHAQGFFSLPRSAAKKSVSTLNQLIQCLYESDPYYQFTTEEIFNDIVSRSNPKDVVYRSSTKKKQFRCLSPSEISGKYNGILSCIAHQYAKVASIPRWYSKGVSSIVSSQYADTLYVIIDTNILIQCASKNLPLEHFYHHIKKKYPSLEKYTVITAVVPFTAIQEAYSIIWDPYTRVRHPLRLLMWARLTSITKNPSVYLLSIISEFPCVCASPITKMAYHKLGLDAQKNANPDVRIVNVALNVQQAVRHKFLVDKQPTPISEGLSWFSFMKYHTRRHHNAVKGVLSEQIVLCTLDKELTKVAKEIGVLCFPIDV